MLELVEEKGEEGVGKWDWDWDWEWKGMEEERRVGFD